MARFNHQLIADERSGNPADEAELKERMLRWVGGRYLVALIERLGEPVGYAVWRDDEDGIYVRQFFVAREHRRRGVGRQAFALLEQGWAGRTVKLDVLPHNERARTFYRSLGFRDHSIILRRVVPAARPEDLT